jgi:integrative and conjugative element protein (TIGR02256 family)
VIAHTIVLSASQRAQIVSIAERAYPAECCGLLVGRDDADGIIVVTRIVESRNVRTDRARDRFEIDPQVRISVERELRGGTDRVVGHYHSHPDHPAQPSATDLEMAFEPDLVWVIVGIAKGHLDAFNAFRLDRDNGTFISVTIRGD